MTAPQVPRLEDIRGRDRTICHDPGQGDHDEHLFRLTVKVDTTGKAIVTAGSRADFSSLPSPCGVESSDATGFPWAGRPASTAVGYVPSCATGHLDKRGRSII
jgi:hypothetical protein